MKTTTWMAMMVAGVLAVGGAAAAKGGAALDGKTFTVDSGEKGKAAGKKTLAKKARKAMFPRSATNPFRAGSSYGTCYDILAKHQDGLSRKKLIELFAKATGKSEKRAGFDAAVLLSAKDSSGERHRSCREGFWIQRENDHLVLRTK